jgi:hypothetical protein
MDQLFSAVRVMGEPRHFGHDEEVLQRQWYKQ